MTMSVNDIFEEFLLDNPDLAGLRADIAQAYGMLRETYDGHGKVLICGNGGSAADSEHIVGELMKGFKLPRRLTAAQTAAFDGIDGGDYIAANLQRSLAAISLVSQTALMTAFANDAAADMMFAQQVYGYGVPGDTLIALSTSGNSASIVNAAKAARAIGVKVLGITGSNESKLSAVADVCVCLPSTQTYRIQEYTLPVYHALCAMLEEEFFGENK
ncbi:MAG: SIS domain-containing protein [Clostridiales bacterium]|nr:SIS domain-containing protein [Clostridiales bacterium]